VSSYAWVEADLRCPSCSTPLGDLAWFTWGAVRGQNASYGPTYRIGDRLAWFVDSRGGVPSDTVFEDGRCTNVGEPTPERLDVWDDRAIPSKCPRCALALSGSVVTIVGGRIVAVEVVTTWPEGVHVRRTAADGTTTHEYDSVLRRVVDP
jgi:hypothetical protein